jgi:hypothetical protein
VVKKSIDKHVEQYDERVETVHAAESVSAIVHNAVFNVVESAAAEAIAARDEALAAQSEAARARADAEAAHVRADAARTNAAADLTSAEAARDIVNQNVRDGVAGGVLNNVEISYNRANTFFNQIKNAYLEIKVLMGNEGQNDDRANKLGNAISKFHALKNQKTSADNTRDVARTHLVIVQGSTDAARHNYNLADAAYGEAIAAYNKAQGSLRDFNTARDKVAVAVERANNALDKIPAGDNARATIDRDKAKEALAAVDAVSPNIRADVAAANVVAGVRTFRDNANTHATDAIAVLTNASNAITIASEHINNINLNISYAKIIIDKMKLFADIFKIAATSAATQAELRNAEAEVARVQALLNVANADAANIRPIAPVAKRAKKNAKTEFDRIANDAANDDAGNDFKTALDVLVADGANKDTLIVTAVNVVIEAATAVGNIDTNARDINIAVDMGILDRANYANVVINESARVRVRIRNAVTRAGVADRPAAAPAGAAAVAAAILNAHRHPALVKALARTANVGNAVANIVILNKFAKTAGERLERANADIAVARGAVTRATANRDKANIKNDLVTAIVRVKDQIVIHINALQAAAAAAAAAGARGVDDAANTAAAAAARTADFLFNEHAIKDAVQTRLNPDPLPDPLPDTVTDIIHAVNNIREDFNNAVNLVRIYNVNYGGGAVGGGIIASHKAKYLKYKQKYLKLKEELKLRGLI